MTLIPNTLSLIRILFVPFILWLLLLEYFIIAGITIAVISSTDIIDGYIARKFNSETLVGFYLDAIADKVLIISIYIVLSIKTLIPLYLIMFIVFREILISGSYLFGLALKISHNLRPNFISKMNTFCQIFLIIFICFFSNNLSIEYNLIKLIGNFLIITVTVTTILSSFFYIFMWVKAVNN